MPRFFSRQTRDRNMREGLKWDAGFFGWAGIWNNEKEPKPGGTVVLFFSLNNRFCLVDFYKTAVSALVGMDARREYSRAC